MITHFDKDFKNYGISLFKADLQCTLDMFRDKNGFYHLFINEDEDDEMFLLKELEIVFNRNTMVSDWSFKRIGREEKSYALAYAIDGEIEIVKIICKEEE